MSKKRRNYSAEFKAKAVSRLISGEQILTQLTKEIGVTPSTLP